MLLLARLDQAVVDCDISLAKIAMSVIDRRVNQGGEEKNYRVASFPLSLLESPLKN